MTLAKDKDFIGQLLDAYAIDADKMGVASEDPEDSGVPLEMQVGAVDSEGWVQWRVLPSTLNENEVVALESEFGVKFPPLYRAYLLARFHMFDQVRSRRYDQQIIMKDTPAGKPLMSIHGLLSAWRSLIDAGFVPFAEWGDGWGPMCFDIANLNRQGECPIVWMEHEALLALEERCRYRDAVATLAHPLYGNCREFFLDLFARA